MMIWLCDGGERRPFDDSNRGAAVRLLHRAGLGLGVHRLRGVASSRDASSALRSIRCATSDHRSRIEEVVGREASRDCYDIVQPPQFSPSPPQKKTKKQTSKGGRIVVTGLALAVACFRVDCKHGAATERFGGAFRVPTYSSDGNSHGELL